MNIDNLAALNFRKKGGASNIYLTFLDDLLLELLRLRDRLLHLFYSSLSLFTVLCVHVVACFLPLFQLLLHWGVITVVQ